MDNISDYIPLLIIIGSVVYSVIKGKGKQRQEEMTKTTLPGRKSGEEVNRSDVFYEVKPEKTGNTENKKKKSAMIPQPVASSTKQTIRTEVENVIIENEESEPVLNIEDMDEVKKAFIYTEIFNRRERQ
jgi:hypothetical protein